MATIFIASPLEDEHVERIRSFDPALEVIHEPDLLPATRYVGDHKGEPFTREGAALTRWRDGLARADILFDLPSAADLPFATRLRWVQTTSTGVGPAVAALGLDKTDVLITTARGVHARPLAEWVFMALLAHFRDLAHQQKEQRAHRWTRICCDEIAGRTLVLIGAGDLARGCARIARTLDMHVIAVARDPARSRAHGEMFDAIVAQSELRTALARAHALVVTVPNTPLTERMIDVAALAALPRGAAVVNIGRGTVIDEDALIAALRSGQVGFAALDVTAVEPLPDASPLWDMPNVMISPHSASTVTGENGRIVDILLANARLWLDGRPGEMRNILDKEQLY